MHISNEFYKNLAYDADLNMIRYETRSSIKEINTFYSLDELLLVNDYNAGISFGLNRARGNCSIASISTSAFEDDADFTKAQLDSGNGFSVRIKSPSSLLALNLNYTYTGVRQMNSIPADIFIAKDNSVKQLKVYNEYAFAFVSICLCCQCGCFVPLSAHNIYHICQYSEY